MEYRPLGRTGVKVSSLCLGTMNFGTRTPEEEAIRILLRAIDDGINFIDTANYYGQPMHGGKGQGETEKTVGKAVKQAGQRHRIILATKVGLPQPDYPDPDPNGAGTSRHHILHQVDESLRRLQTDYIDLYYLHRPNPAIPIDETLRALDDLVRSGKVRYLGTSMFAPWRLVEALWTSDRLGLNRFVVEQMKYSMLTRGPETHLFETAKQFDLGLIPYSTLAGGVLTGKYRDQSEPPTESRQNFRPWASWAKSFETDYTPALLDLLEQIAEEHSATVSQIAVAWTLRSPVVASALIGPRTLEQYEDNLGAVALRLTEENYAAIDAIAPVTGTSGS